MYVLCMYTYSILYSNSGPWVLNPYIPDPWVLRSTEYSILEGVVDRCAKHADLEGSVGCIPRESGGIHGIISVITRSPFVFSYSFSSETSLGLLTISK